MTVGDLIDALSAFDRDTTARLAINPFHPLAHRMGSVTQSVDEHGRPVVYIAESPEAEQFPLPPAVAVVLTWQGPVEAPPRRRRGATGSDNGQ
ncbi:hypothetical protein [Streptomyces venezuelae]|uniref:Uncharacterized protein n=1 Tax=Streptomyces venezuelae TaxID=54571 RepID=A0A5P2BLX9_STRVZ|nr:hypothetical protein [Streptomyces venezuelae]QES31455.1 hypothetical protein DEJ47_12990 [Streptomyces venezuelae]